MAGRGLEPEQMVKTGHALNPAQGQLQSPRHLEQGRPGQIAVDLLNLMEHFNQAIAATTLALNQAGDALRSRIAWIWSGR